MGSLLSQPLPIYQDNQIYLNVYRIAIAPGSYHTSVIVLNYEISFACQAGIWMVTNIGSQRSETDGNCYNLIPWKTRFVESILVGELPKSFKDKRPLIGLSLTVGEGRLMQLLDDMSKKFDGKSYHLIRLNCNHFCEEFIQRLIAPTRFKLPSYITRITRLWPNMCHDVCLCAPDTHRTARRRKRSKNTQSMTMTPKETNNLRYCSNHHWNHFNLPIKCSFPSLSSLSSLQSEAEECNEWSSVSSNHVIYNTFNSRSLLDFQSPEPETVSWKPSYTYTPSNSVLNNNNKHFSSFLYSSNNHPIDFKSSLLSFHNRVLRHGVV